MWGISVFVGDIVRQKTNNEMKQKSLKERRNEAEIIVAEISKQLEFAQSEIKKSLGQLEIATKTKKDFQKLLPSINRITNSTETAIDKIRKDRDNLSKLLTTVSSFYNKKYIPLAEKINNSETGLNAKIRQGTKFESELKKVKTNYFKQIELIKELVGNSRTNLNELKKINSSIRKVEINVLSKEKNINKNLTEIESSRIKVDASTKNILDAENVIKKKENLILDLFKKSDKAFSQIEYQEKAADGLLERIKTIYEIAAGTGLGGEFDKRRIALGKELLRWRKHIFWSTVAVFVIIISFFIIQLSGSSVEWDISKLKFDANFYARFLLTSPLVFYIVFATNQFIKTKSLLEKYAFKTALALSIDAHINLLTNIEKLQDTAYMGKITNFILEGFNKIYLEPYQKEENIKSKSILNEILMLIKTMKPQK